MTMFDVEEIKGRELFQKLTDQHQAWTINKFSPIELKKSWDVSIWSGNTPVIVEIKVRNIYIKQYPEAIIEINKLDEINKLTETTPGAVGYYVAFYPADEKAAMWPINDYSYTSYCQCEKTHCGLNRTKIDKRMAYYPLSAATIYDYSE